MVSSTARPTATPAMRLVAMDRGIPSQPMTPKLTTIGKQLGRMPIMPTLKDMNNKNIMAKTSTSVMARLLICPSVINRLL